MSRFDENLFGRIAVLNGYITQDQLRECVESAGTDPQQHIGQLLLERGYLTEDQYRHMTEIRERKVRKLLRSKEDAAQHDRDFGKAALRKGYVRLEGLEGAVLQQQQLRRLNLHFNLAEVLLSRQQLTLRQVKDVLARLGRGLLRCSLCDFQYQVADQRDGESYQCPKCGSVLDPPVYLDPLMAEGTVTPAKATSAEQVPASDRAR